MGTGYPWQPERTTQFTRTDRTRQPNPEPQHFSRIGSVSAPCEVSLSASDLLETATLGIFAVWRDTDRKLFAETVIRLILRALPNDVTVHEDDRCNIRVNLPDDTTKDLVIRSIEDARGESLDTEVRQPSLF